jgi:hypothetical protein
MLVCIAAFASPALAQNRKAEAPKPQPGTILGVVIDTLGRPLDSAYVFLNGRNRQVITGPDGTFRFDSLSGNAESLVARHSGYFPASQRVRVGKDGASVVLELSPRMNSLPPVITEARLTGLRGVVSDTAFNPIEGAEVQAMGGVGGIVKTDSGGTFFVDVNPGHYMVRVTKPGHLPQMIGVTVPEEGGRRIAVRLMPGEDPYHARESVYAFDLRARLIRRSPVGSHLYTREDIAKLNPRATAQLATLGVSQRVDDECDVWINGGMDQVPLWSLDPAELELLEVYEGSLPGAGDVAQKNRGVTSLRGNAAMGGQKSAATNGSRSVANGMSKSLSCPATIIAWISR